MGGRILTFLGFVVLMGLFVVGSQVPTLGDQRTSRAITEEVFQKAHRSGIALKKTDLDFMAKRGETQLVVNGTLSEQDIRQLNTVVKEVESQHQGRKVALGQK